MKSFLKISKYITATVLLIVVGANLLIILSTKSQLHNHTESLRDSQIGIVLGTSRLTIKGEKNSFFEARIDAGAKLLQDNKIARILVSGDNETRYYNEPKDMAQALRERGVSDSLIFQDAAGLRTFDSIYRLKSVFKSDEAIIVTQRFHAYRALYIANHLGIKAQAYEAEKPTSSGYLVYLREWIARPLALWDLYIINRQPKYTN